MIFYAGRANHTLSLVAVEGIPSSKGTDTLNISRRLATNLCVHTIVQLGLITWHLYVAKFSGPRLDHVSPSPSGRAKIPSNRPPPLFSIDTRYDRYVLIRGRSCKLVYTDTMKISWVPVIPRREKLALVVHRSSCSAITNQPTGVVGVDQVLFAGKN